MSFNIFDKNNSNYIMSKEVVDELLLRKQELGEENQALHQEVSRLIDEVGKRDLTIQQLGNQIMQMQGKIERLQQHSIELSKQDSSFDEIQDLRDLVNDICMMVFQFNYNEERGYSTGSASIMSGFGIYISDGRHDFFLDKINKVMGYEVNNEKSDS